LKWCSAWFLASHYGKRRFAIAKIHSGGLIIFSGDEKMKSTFHELELDRAVVQNATSIGTEQLIVTLKPGSQSLIQFQIKENTNADSSNNTASSISIDRHGLKKLFEWLQEGDALQ
jgi:hypothetical protein